MTEEEKAVCLFPNCKDKVRTRGLCSRHYAMARALIAAGKVTEEQLITAGKMAKPYRQSAAEDNDWFLQATDSKENS